MRNKLNLILLILLIPILINCSGVKEALEGQKRSNQSDEFLVKKKNPLQMPPDINKLPQPGDGQKISIGADNPLEIQHSSTSGQVEIKSNANISIMSGDRVQIEDESGGNIAEFVKSSGCQLYHNVSGTPTVRLETTNDGVTISGDLTADSVQLPDLKKLELGDNQELSIFHKPDTNDVRVEVESNTNYILLTKTFDLKNAGGSKAAITATNPGGVPEVLLYHDGNERLKTTSNGVTITGTASATTFSGNLTGNATSATTAGNATSATTAGTVTTAAQPNITSLGTLTSLLLSGHLEFNSTNANCGDIISTGGHDATFGIFNSTSVSNISGITFHCRNNGGTGYVNVADFKVGASDKIESVFKGEVTAVQPACLLTDATTVNVSNSTNNTPFGFNTIQTNVGCTVNSAKSKITVPSAGTYLVSACIAGIRTNSTVPTDSVKFILHKGGSVFPDDQTFPGGVIGTDNNEEFNFTFSLPLVLAANDELEILLINLNSSGGTATINKGYFSVTKLH